jgi:uncharacterized membrane-anchored protein
MKLLQLASFLFFLTACNNSGNSDTQTVKTHADSLMDEVLEGHNSGMAKMDRLNEAKKAIQHVLDSISNLSTALQKSSAQYKMQLDSAFNRLTFADFAMNKWMNEFNMDSFKNNKEEQAKYLESEKIKISKVNNAMISSLRKADSVIKKR